ncbi:MAG: tyrosine-type recombinase/integrase [Chloroflexi bacterium]|nr:tyrosine-type recombinase/integrase [Chloroflexota bacterium]
MIDTDPLDGVRSVDQQPLSPKWLEKKEQGKLVREAERSINAKTDAGKRQALRDRAIVVLLLHTGLRVGELCNLQMDDLD